MIKNILIVGGSSGLGFELIREYNNQGHKVFFVNKKYSKFKKKFKKLKN